MRIPYLKKPKGTWFVKVPKSKKYPRHWMTTVELTVVLSDGYELIIKKGTFWDGASVPKWLWWLFKPIDEGALADLIHDELWIQKEEQLKRFDFHIYATRLFADNERLRWRKGHAPSKKVKNFLTNFVIRLIGGFYYSRQMKIPK